MTLGLLLIELGLQLRSHLVISVLSFFEVKSDLMNIGKSVEIFVLIHGHIGLLIILLKARFHYDNLSL